MRSEVEIPYFKLYFTFCVQHLIHLSRTHESVITDKKEGRSNILTCSEGCVISTRRKREGCMCSINCEQNT